MSTFREAGYLSQHVSNEIEKFSSHFASWKSLYYELNEFAFRQFLSCAIDENNVVELLIYACFYRILTIYQSAYLLIERGSDTEAKVLLRSLVETLFVLAASHKDKKFVRKYILVDDASRIKMIENALEVHESLKANKAPTMLTSEQVNEMRTSVTAHKAKHFKPTLTKAEKKQANKDKDDVNVKNVASTAGLTIFYKTHYSYLCMYTHPSPASFGEYFALDDRGAIKDFRIGQRWKDAEANMRIAIVMLLEALGSLALRFKLPIESELKTYQNKLNEVITNSRTQNIKGD